MTQKTKLIQKGMSHMKAGSKHVTKSFFHRTLDWDSGSSEYLKAAKCFKGAREWENCVEAYKQASKCNYQNGTIFAAGRNLEDASNIVNKELKDPKTACDMLEKAANFYREAGKGDVAAKAYSIAGKMLETIDSGRALDCYKNAIELYELEEKEHFGTETYRRAVAMCVKNKNFEDAIVMLDSCVKVFQKLNQPSSLHKAFLSYTIIYLTMDQFENAEKKNQKCLSIDQEYLRSNEFEAANGLLDAFESYDEEKLKEAKKHRALKYVDNQVGQLARKIELGSEIPLQNNIKKIEDVIEKDELMKIQKNRPTMDKKSVNKNSNNLEESSSDEELEIKKEQNNKRNELFGNVNTSKEKKKTNSSDQEGDKNRNELFGNNNQNSKQSIEDQLGIGSSSATDDSDIEGML
ncbi:gamma-soluble nsf attachment protein [Anaeramoeba flamelloides]|uniref:Gamma-soluble NSF attachment protein n=1 Tax=Anaeramoeba flamelloides TaxID=1746091 RepID=A0ABQ8YM87_9EUKA|nr:gamma-soluble nsf attachment protein [Anaeramoeba flamelloides]